jgi:single-stranded-DNA-specific exonuclease
MALGIECLLTENAAQARDIASTLNEINAERRAVQQQMTDEAELAFARVAIDAAAMPMALCLFDGDWHPGVVGLVASKMKERLHRPVIAFAPAEPGSTQLRGSARSIPGFHIRDALADVAAQHPDLIERFGGHAMAAGLSLRLDAFDAFREAFDACARRILTPELLQADVLSDGELEVGELDRVHAESLRDGGPWGQGFPEPVFSGNFEVVSHRVLSEKHLKLVLRMEGRAEPLNAIHFNGWDGTPPPKYVLAAFKLEPDDYRGGDAIQLNVVYRESV